MFQPIVPVSGLTGWIFLNSTLDKQTEAFNGSPEIVRDTDYFEAQIGEITTAKQLVSDRRLLRVALGAFGLGDDIDNQYLIRKILEEGVENPTALANKLSDDRYKQFSAAFGFGSLSPPATLAEGFGAGITAKFRSRQFEVAVGDQDQSLRLAMNAERELAAVAGDDATEDARWFRILGTPPLRAVFEKAFGLPTGFGQLDIDRQLEVFKTSASKRLGVSSIDEFSSKSIREKLVETYLLQEQISSFSAQTGGSIALTLLQSSSVRF